MFVVVDLKLVDKDIQFTSTKRLMYGENIIRLEIDGGKFIDESQPFKWVYKKKHIYLNDDSFAKLTQPKINKQSPEIEWER